MEINQISTSTAAMTTAVKQIQEVQKLQMEMMKNLADSQRQMTDLLAAAGIGTNIETSA